LVHPIERLRFVARAARVSPSILAAEAAWALADLAEEEVPALVPACRRLLDRQPGCGPLWWLAARVLCAGDPVTEAQQCARDLEGDPTSVLMLQALPEGARVVRRGGMGDAVSAEFVVLEVDALGPTGMVVDSSCTGLLSAARSAEVPVWVEAGVGRVLPSALWEAMTARLASSQRPEAHGSRPGSDARPAWTPGPRGHSTLLDHRGVELVVGPEGAQSLQRAIADGCVPGPPELLEGF